MSSRLELVAAVLQFFIVLAMAENLPFRLPNSIRPLNYTLRIVTHFNDDSFRFYGEMSVDMDVIRETDKVRLHAKDLHVDYRSVSLTPIEEADGPGSGTAPSTSSAEENNNIPATSRADARAARARSRLHLHPPVGHYVHALSEASFRGMDIVDVAMEKEYDELVVSTAVPLQEGSRFRLSLRYWGTLNEEDRGYYRGSYVYKNRTRWMSATVFEPIGAREAFPCFDEPGLKANFTLILGRHRNYTTRANMPMEHSEPMDGGEEWFWDYYPPTPKMSTYLVAFMVHLLESRSSNHSTPGRPVRVWAPPGRTQFSNFSLWLAPRVLDGLGSTLGVSAVLPKQDLVAVPGFRSEALENWGLVSFEERHLLLPPDATQLAQQSVGSVVAHELAHIWFGNLLTPSWWSDIWLSEGFATYYSAVAMAQVFPSWRIHETSAGSAYLLVTSVDATPVSLPLLHPADNPHKLTTVFSAISYYKGYWMLRMLNHTLGEDVFDDGIRRYVQRHLYSSVSSGDLWTALQEAVDNHAVPREGGEISPTATARSEVTASSADKAGRDSRRQTRDVGQVPIALLVGGSELSGLVDEDSVRDADGEESTATSPTTDEWLAEKDEYPDVDTSDKQSPTEQELPKGTTKQETPLLVEPGPGSVRLPRPMAEIMSSWLKQPGYPIISVHRNYNTGSVLVSQRRYMSPSHRPGLDSCNTTWWVPVVYVTGRSGSPSVGTPSLSWLPPTCANVTLPSKVPRDSWILLNVGLTGLYRVHYDPRTLQQLSRLPRAAWQAVPPLTRMQLIADALGQAREGRARYPNALDLAALLRRETSPMVWRAAVPQLLYLERQLRGRQEGLALKTWLLDMLIPHAGSIGFSSRTQDSPPQASLRQEVTALACRADHLICTRQARKALKQLIAGRQQVLSGSLTKTMLCSAVRWSGPSEWRFLRSFASQLSGSNRRAVISALGCSRDSETLRSVLAETVSPNSTVRSSEIAVVLSAVAENELGADVTIRFIEENAVKLHKRLGGSQQRVERMLRDVCVSLNNAKQLERLDGALRHFRALTTSRSPPTWGRDKVRENMLWMERSRADVARWLRAKLDDDDEFRHSGLATSKER